MKRIIGLTGGIATGKTTVSNYLAKTYNLLILDADIYAREAVKVGSPILIDIVYKYGQAILLSDGNLNRQKLSEIIFNNKSEKQWLEDLIHPYVRKSFIDNIGKYKVSILVLVIPLLFEVDLTDLVTETWVVYCSEQQQLKRLMQRNNLTLLQAQSRINSQMPLSEKVSRADVVLDNSLTQDVLFQEVDVALKNII
ncbi:MAG: dephospho-CoA kinase [Cyanobacteria bacterium P01_A01_bin.84]